MHLTQNTCFYGPTKTTNSVSFFTRKSSQTVKSSVSLKKKENCLSTSCTGFKSKDRQGSHKTWGINVYSGQGTLGPGCPGMPLAPSEPARPCYNKQNQSLSKGEWDPWQCVMHSEPLCAIYRKYWLCVTLTLLPAFPEGPGDPKGPRGPWNKNTGICFSAFTIAERILKRSYKKNTVWIWLSILPWGQ